MPSMNFQTKDFIEFAKKNTVPTYVKQAFTNSFSEVTDPRTKAGIYLAKFASLNGDNVISTKELNKRAQIFNISEDLVELTEKYAEFKEAKTVKTAPPIEKYPIRSKEEYVAATNYLIKNASALTVDDRRELANNILNTSNKYNTEVTDEIYKYAGLGVADPEVIVDELVKRATLIGQMRNKPIRERTKQAKQLVDIAVIVKQNGVDEESRDKIAAVLDIVDTNYDLTGHYKNAYLRDPDKVVCAYTQKTANEVKTYSYTFGTQIFDIRDFEKIKVAEVINLLGEDFADAMTTDLFMDHTKIAECLDVMTELEKEVFSELIKEANIKPKGRVEVKIDLKELSRELNK